MYTIHATREIAQIIGAHNYDIQQDTVVKDVSLANLLVVMNSLLDDGYRIVVIDGAIEGS